ncbi:MAG: hypothetical protein SR1Q7_03180 [Quinella sp. 1Q7]|nr:hypothetical protein [Quinella sp. 1Q7]
MATREENLNKINAELEAMSDEELSMVAGGTKYEMANDSRFLNSLNGSCDRYGEWRVLFEENLEEIKEAWKTVGIVAHLWDGANKNEYYLDGKQITQEEARQHAMKVTGHYMTEKDWKW